MMYFIQNNDHYPNDDFFLIGHGVKTYCHPIGPKVIILLYIEIQ
jgi:hypothetical protein